MIQTTQVRKSTVSTNLLCEIKKKKDFDLKNVLFLPSSTLSRFQMETVILIMFGEGKKDFSGAREAIPYGKF